MQNQHRANLPALARPGRQHTASPQDVIAAIDRVVACVQGDTDAVLYAAWAVTTLASRLNITCALSTSTDPIGIVHDLGVAWAAEIGTALDQQPGRRAETLLAAKAVIEQVMADVKSRGLAG